jgi:hypothetical protein
MKRAPFIALASIALFAEPAVSEIFECVDASGSVTFVNDRSACPDAKPHRLEGRIERAPSSVTRAKEATPDSAAILSPVQRLEWTLLEERHVRPGWDVVDEMPEDPTKDADLVEWGVVAKRTRHYTRKSGSDSQVCSVELWAFENDARARLAHQNFEFPDWKIDRKGDTLVMLRAVTLRGGTTDRTIYPDCEKLGNIVRARADKFVDE